MNEDPEFNFYPPEVPSAPSVGNIIASPLGTIMNGGAMQSPNYSQGNSGWQINSNGDVEFNDGTFRGAIAATTIDIGGSDSSSFHVDIDGNLWLGAATFGAAPFSVSNTGALTATSATISGYSIKVKGTFGGDGSDGALAITSGTTTLSLASAKYVIYNYTTVSITGTGKLAFSNPNSDDPGGSIIRLKSQGAMTLTSSTAPMLDASALGAQGSDGIDCTAGGGSGGNGEEGQCVWSSIDNGIGGVSGPSGGTGGAGGAALVPTFALSHTAQGAVFYAVGGGGGGGACGGGTQANRGAAGAGGRGGGVLIIECGGALNFTTASGISVAGGAGGNGGNGGTGAAGGGGGGGGGGGTCVLLYNTLTAASGTITVAGGAGGNASTGLANTGGGGGGGGSSQDVGNAGSNASGANGGAGGAGGTGKSAILLNTEFG